MKLMTIRKKWGAMIVAACCFLVGGTDAAWSRETPARGSNTAHITVNDTVYGVLHNHRSLMSIKENRSVLEHELNKARAFWPARGRHGGDRRGCPERHHVPRSGS